MAIELNQFAPNQPIAGLYVYMANLPQLHNLIVSENQDTALTYGSIVTLDNAVTNTNAPVVKQAAVTDEIFGVITYNPVKAQFVSGDRVAIARPNDIIWMPKAEGVISMGATLYFNAENQVTATETAGNSIIGRAITSAAINDEFVQVQLGFETTTA